MSGAVTVEALVKRFGALRAVDGVDFTVAEGEFFTLLGPSGCGKTTTLRCVAGLESADEGRIGIGGAPVFDAAAGLDLAANERTIGMVFQSYAVWPHMSVAENIGYPLKIRGAARAEIDARVEQVLDILEMAGLGARMPSQLSGGQQQRVALGRALAVEPRVLLLDEPLSNLDAKLREQMRAELKSIQRQTGLPILYVTHDQIEALALSDRIAVMANGRIHQLSPPEAVYNRPRTRFVLEFIGSVNYLPCRVAEDLGRTLRLALAEGELELARPVDVPEGRDLELAIRPEDLAMQAPIAGAPAAGAPAARAPVAEVVLRSFLGDGFEYHLKLGGLKLRARTDTSVEVEEGATVGITVRKGLLLPVGSPSDAPIARPGSAQTSSPGI